MASSDASGSIEISATPDAVFALITDLDVLAELADETETMRWTKGSVAEAGAQFRGGNRNGRWHWTTTCTVTKVLPGRRFAFDVRYLPIPIASWRYDIEATEHGCRVTESTQDRRPPGFPLLSGVATGIQDRGRANALHIQATLQRLKARAEMR